MFLCMPLCILWRTCYDADYYARSGVYYGAHVLMRSIMHFYGASYGAHVMMHVTMHVMVHTMVHILVCMLLRILWCIIWARMLCFILL